MSLSSALRKRKVAKLIREINEANHLFNELENNTDIQELNKNMIDLVSAYRKGLLYNLRDCLVDMYGWWFTDYD